MEKRRIEMSELPVKPSSTLKPLFYACMCHENMFIQYITTQNGFVAFQSFNKLHICIKSLPMFY